MYVANLFDNKRILITGGGTGLGKAMASQFLALGADIYICGRRKGVCEDTARELMDAHGGSVKAFGIDIRNAGDVDAMVEEIFADGPLTDLVNNAAGNFISRTENISANGFDAIANIVMHGTFYMTHAVGRRWIADGNPGNVLSIITTWVKNGGPFTVPSAMSKSAIHTMTMSLATEWGQYGIRLNAIGPGEIPTEGMSNRLNPGEKRDTGVREDNPLGRCGTKAELQNLATFLLSDGCGWLTGESIMMDGASHLGTGGNFYALREWDDARWQQARESIQAQNDRDKSNRS